MLQQGKTLSSCFSSDTESEHPFHSLFKAIKKKSSSLVISLFKTACRDNTYVLSSVPKSKKDMLYLTEKKICMKEKLYSSMSYGWPRVQP